MNWQKTNPKWTQRMEQIISDLRRREQSRAVVQGKVWHRGEPLSDVDPELAEFITKKDVTANTWR